VLPDRRVAWRDVWLGALVTSLLFNLGKFAIGLYIARSSVADSYGAAGSLAVLLVWVYYSAQILFLGAEFTHVYARTHGSLRGTPAEGTRPLRPDETKPKESKPWNAFPGTARSAGGR
jgi:membrane protein